MCYPFVHSAECGRIHVTKQSFDWYMVKIPNSCSDRRRGRISPVMHFFDHRQLVSAPGGFTGICTAGAGVRIFGGHSLSHSLNVASLAIDHSRTVSSLHAVFLSPGNASEPVLFSAEPLKRGRALDTVRVGAVQDERQILESLVTFHDGEESIEFQAVAPETIPAEALSDDPLHRHSGSDARSPFHCRTVPSDPREPQVRTWIRLREAAGDAPSLLHQAALTYALDFLITKAAHNPIDEEGVRHLGASLDHAMWFHRRFRVDEWLLVEATSNTFAGSRSLSHASVYDHAGRLVSSASQEALLRRTI